MASFNIKVRQPLPVLKDVGCTNNAQQIYGGKMLNSLTRIPTGSCSFLITIGNEG
jgi:hypothetical protein